MSMNKPRTSDQLRLFVSASSISMRIICSCDPSGHLGSRQKCALIPRSALLSSLDRGYPCFSPVGAVNDTKRTLEAYEESLSTRKKL